MTLTVFSLQPRKSLGTPKSPCRKDKENVSVHSPSRKSLSRTPRGMPAANSQPATPTVRVKTPPTKKKSLTPAKVPHPPTPPIPSSEKKGRVATPTVGRSRRSSTRSSRRSSLFSISEEEEVRKHYSFTLCFYGPFLHHY